MLQVNVSTIDKNDLYNKLEKEKERLEQIAYEKELKKKLLNDFDIKFSYLNDFNANNLQKQDLSIPKKHEYNISELLYFSDLDFVKNCYRAILNREPDDAGINNYINKLRSGKLHKIDIIGRMYLSKEARVNRIKVNGLWTKFIFRTILKIPLLGYLIQLIISILRLPTILKRNEQLENHISQLISQENQLIYEKLKLLQENDNKIIDDINSNIMMLETGLANIVSELKNVEKRN